ncbi:MAG: TIM barrel protein [Pirellulaceae bacterium]
MLKSAVTISLVDEARAGPFVYHGGLADGFHRAALAGFDAVEIFPPSAEELDLAAVRDLVQRHGLGVAAVGTGAGWLRWKLRLTDPAEDVRRRAEDFIAALIRVAAQLGAPAILGSMQGRWEGTVSRAQALDWLAGSLDRLGAVAEKCGGGLLYEFLNRYESNLCQTVDESLAWMDSLPVRPVRLLCDLFHMNIEEADVAAALRRGGTRVGHIHFADSNRRAMGFGHTDLGSIGSALWDMRYDGYLSAEIFPLPDADAAARQTMASFRQVQSC